MRNQTGFGTLIAIIAFVVLAGPGVALSQTAGAVQYPPLSIGEDAQPPPPAKMMSQPVSPRQIEFGVGGSSLPPAKPPYGIDLDTDRLLMQPVPLNGASPVPPTRGGSS